MKSYAVITRTTVSRVTSALSRFLHEVERRWRKWLNAPQPRALAQLDIVPSTPPAFPAGSRAHCPFSLQTRSEPMIRGAVCPNAGTYGSVGARGGNDPGPPGHTRLTLQVATDAVLSDFGQTPSLENRTTLLILATRGWATCCSCAAVGTSAGCFPCGELRQPCQWVDSIGRNGVQFTVPGRFIRWGQRSCRNYRRSCRPGARRPQP